MQNTRNDHTPVWTCDGEEDESELEDDETAEEGGATVRVSMEDECTNWGEEDETGAVSDQEVRVESGNIAVAENFQTERDDGYDDTLQCN